MSFRVMYSNVQWDSVTLKTKFYLNPVQDVGHLNSILISFQFNFNKTTQFAIFEFRFPESASCALSCHSNSDFILGLYFLFFSILVKRKNCIKQSWRWRIYKSNYILKVLWNYSVKQQTIKYKSCKEVVEGSRKTRRNAVK